MSTPRKSNLLVKNTGMSLNDRFTQIQKKSKPIVEDELIRKHRILSFNMERRPEVAASLLMSQDFVNRERLRVPLPPPLPPPRTEINNRMYNSLMHDMIRSSDRVGIPVHERLTIGRPPLVEDRRRIRRRRGPKNKIREPVKPNVNTNGNSQGIPKISKSKKRQNSKQRDQFPRKDHVISKEDLDQQLDQFMSHTKQKRDEELNRVIQENS
ncbi:ACYPI003585 protein [Aphis craccivora]|uniref:ACYPI003585 protein n=1 Tax=Aphis craccivora TaxID=307492 RepID=A0A6G0XQ55_APHCR|nr:ACYPI003585 protein [Aphis craccivora]